MRAWRGGDTAAVVTAIEPGRIGNILTRWKVLMTRKKWSDLDERTRRLIAAAAIVEAVLKTAMLVDLQRRWADRIRGPKWLWRPLAFVNFFGPVSYFAFGRRRTAR